MNEIFLVTIVFITFGLSVLGVFMPFLPGIFLFWLAVFIYAMYYNFAFITLTTILWLLFLSSLVVGIDFIAPIIGAKRHKASWGGIIGTALGFFFGLVTMGLPGVVIGPIAGAFLGELVNGRSHEESVNVALGSFFGFLVGSLLKIILIVVMFSIFIASIV